MTYAEYAHRGYQYSDYLKLSQRQRAIGLWLALRARRSDGRPMKLHVMVSVIWPISDWDFSGINQSQEWEHICLGPFQITLQKY